jgi:predicted enzyme related to lactoylglutathione lyase
MTQRRSPVVHLELHTANLPRACAFLRDLCGWTTERVETEAGPYQALDPGFPLSGGVVECQGPRSLWLPYVEVDNAAVAVARATELGAGILLEPREGPAGWRGVVTTPEGGELAFWQPKR